MQCQTKNNKIMTKANLLKLISLSDRIDRLSDHFSKCDEILNCDNGTIVTQLCIARAALDTILQDYL